MTELSNASKKKRKLSLLDNFIGIPFVAFLLLCVGQFLSMYVLSLPLNAVAEFLIPGITATGMWFTATFYLNFLGIWIVVLLFLAATPKNRPILKALTTKTKGNTLKMFAVGLGIGLGMNLLCAFIAMLNGDIHITFDSFRPISFLFVFLAVLIQSGAEELICRVFVYQRMMRRYGSPVFAALVNAAFFSLIHLGNDGAGFLPLLNIFIYGLLFSAMVIWMDSPWATMAAHASWNFCQNILLGLPNSGNVLPYSVFKLETATATDSFAYSVAFGLEGTITACVTLFAVAALIVWWGTKHKVVPTPVWEVEA